jgi:hypothetical protein
LTTIPISGRLSSASFLRLDDVLGVEANDDDVDGLPGPLDRREDGADGLFGCTMRSLERLQNPEQHEDDDGPERCEREALANQIANRMAYRAKVDDPKDAGVMLSTSGANEPGRAHDAEGTREARHHTSVTNEPITPRMICVGTTGGCRLSGRGCGAQNTGLRAGGLLGSLNELCKSVVHSPSRCRTYRFFSKTACYPKTSLAPLRAPRLRGSAQESGAVAGVPKENQMKVIGAVLMVLGIVGLLYGGLSWTRRDTVVNAGPIQITKDKRETLPLPPIAGAVLLVAGVGLLIKR